MKKKLIPMMLLAGGCLFARTNFSVGVGIGTPGYYAPPVAVSVRPPCPGPGYTWVNGYYQANGVGIAGYWAPPAYVAAPYASGRNWDRDRFQDRDDFHVRDRDDHRGHAEERGHDDGRRR